MIISTFISYSHVRGCGVYERTYSIRLWLNLDGTWLAYSGHILLINVSDLPFFTYVTETFETYQMIQFIKWNVVRYNSKCCTKIFPREHHHNKVLYRPNVFCL